MCSGTSLSAPQAHVTVRHSSCCSNLSAKSLCVVRNCVTNNLIISLHRNLSSTIRKISYVNFPLVNSFYLLLHSAKRAVWATFISINIFSIRYRRSVSWFGWSLNPVFRIHLSNFQIDRRDYRTIGNAFTKVVLLWFSSEQDVWPFRIRSSDLLSLPYIVMKIWNKYSFV